MRWFTIVVALVFSCERTETPTRDDDHARAFTACLEADNAAQWERLAACYRNDAVFESPGLDDPHGIEEHLSALFPLTRSAAQLVLSADNDIISVVRVTGASDDPTAVKYVAHGRL